MAEAGKLHLLLLHLLLVSHLFPSSTAQLSQNYYAATCPSAESIVRAAVVQKMQTSAAAAPGALRLFFHDCFVRGCDASVLLLSGDGNDEHNTGADVTLSPDALALIDSAKAALEAQCPGQVSCADIIAIAARDAVSLTGGPFFPVELGRLDGKVATRAVVPHSLPSSGFNLDQLNSLFAFNGLSQTDMIALSGAHTVGVSHCDKFVRRIYRFRSAPPNGYSPPMDVWFMRQLRQSCPLPFSGTATVSLDPVTPAKFDNAYYGNLQKMKGLLASDQILFSDRRSRATVNLFAANQTAFFEAFVSAMGRLGRVGLKGAGSDGEIRRVCSKVN